MLSIRRFWVLMLLVFAATFAQAGPAEDAQVVVKTVTDQVLAKLRVGDDGEKRTAQEVYALVNEIVVPHFDSVAMSQLVLGKHWRKAKKDQKLAFIKEFRTLLVRTYGTALASYTDERIEYDAPRLGSKGDRAKVRTRIIQSGGPDIPIAYSLRLKGEAWKVYDVAIDGISMVTNYRSGFSQRINRDGIDELIKRMKARNSG